MLAHEIPLVCNVKKVTPSINQLGLFRKEISQQWCGENRYDNNKIMKIINELHNILCIVQKTKKEVFKVPSFLKLSNQIGAANSIF